MRVLATAAVVVALVVVPAGVAHADPTTEPVDPSAAVTFSVVPFGRQGRTVDAKVLTIESPQASVDGSVTEDGKVITLRGRRVLRLQQGHPQRQVQGCARPGCGTSDRAAGHHRQGQRLHRQEGNAAYNKGVVAAPGQGVLAGLGQRLDGLKGVIKAYGEEPSGGHQQDREGSGAQPPGDDHRHRLM